MDDYPLAELALSRRLERCEAETNVSFIEARQALHPESGAVWMECNGTYARICGQPPPQGWSEYPELADFMHDIGRVTAASRGTSAFLAELDGSAIATGAVAIHNGVALLAGASTIPSARKQGAQQ